MRAVKFTAIWQICYANQKSLLILYSNCENYIDNYYAFMKKWAEG